MKLFKLSLAALIFSISSIVLAEGGSDRIFERTIKNEQAMAACTAKHHFDIPLDIKKKGNMAAPIKSCDIMPSRMIYEDSADKLNVAEDKVLEGAATTAVKPAC